MSTPDPVHVSTPRRDYNTPRTFASLETCYSNVASDICPFLLLLRPFPSFATHTMVQQTHIEFDWSSGQARRRRAEDSVVRAVTLFPPQHDYFVSGDEACDLTRCGHCCLSSAICVSQKASR